MSIDDGYFPRSTSVLRRVQEQRCVGLFYGQRALCIGALSPLNYVGTSEHTANKQSPFKRLARTGERFEAVMLGSRAQADRVLEAVQVMHQRVNGALPADAGPHRAGTRYDALDPALMLWTIAVMMDSAARFHDLLVRPLRSEERESLWQDYIHFGVLFGMPREGAPPTYAEFREYYDGYLASDQVWLTDEARYVGYFTAFEIPMPAHAQPAKRVHDLLMLGSLPPRVRELYGLPWTRAHAAAFPVAVHAVRNARRALPGVLARGSNVRFFDGVADTEARRLRTGRPTPQVGLRPTEGSRGRGRDALTDRRRVA
jgi:uncharacterized protein (DUF2236 family)